MEQIRVSLNARDFEKLVAGEVIEPEPGILIALHDIGWDLMQTLIRKAQSK